MLVNTLKSIFLKKNKKLLKQKQKNVNVLFNLTLLQSTV